MAPKGLIKLVGGQLELHTNAGGLKMMLPAL